MCTALDTSTHKAAALPPHPWAQAYSALKNRLLAGDFALGSRRAEVALGDVLKMSRAFGSLGVFSDLRESVVLKGGGGVPIRL